MMKKILLVCSLLFSVSVFAKSQAVAQIEISEEKSVERHSYYFGSVYVNSRNFVNYRVTNTGVTPLVYQSATVGGIGFHARHNCTGVLAPGARCTFTVEFSPFFEGFHVGNFLLSFDQGYEIYVSLSGQAYR